MWEREREKGGFKKKEKQKETRVKERWVVTLQRLITLFHQSPQSDTTYAFFHHIHVSHVTLSLQLALSPTVQGRVALTRSTQKSKSASWPLRWAPQPDLNISSAAVLSGDSLGFCLSPTILYRRIPIIVFLRTIHDSPSHNLLFPFF